MKSVVYSKVLEFKHKYPSTIAWRLRRHSKVIEKHLNKGEEVLYAFTGQKNDSWYNLFLTAVFVITNKRLLIATDRVLFGYFLTSITPDMFNDLKVYSGLVFGKVEIDTIKEYITVSNVSKRAIDEIETSFTEYVLKEKKKFMNNKGTK